MTPCTSRSMLGPRLQATLGFVTLLNLSNVAAPFK